jgi:hypothetical protein
MTVERQISIITEEFNNAQIDRFIFAVQKRMEKLYVTPVPHTIDMIAEFLHVSKTTIQKMTREGVLPVHYLPNFKIPYWFPDECVDCIRKHKNKY